MPNTNFTEESKVLLEKLIDDAVEKIDFSMEYIYNDCQKLINLASEAKLIEKVKELEAIQQEEKFNYTPTKNAEINPY